MLIFVKMGISQPLVNRHGALPVIITALYNVGVEIWDSSLNQNALTG